MMKKGAFCIFFSNLFYDVAESGDVAGTVSNGCWHNTLLLWDLDCGQCLAVYHAGAMVEGVAVSPQGGRIVCGTVDGQMHFLTLRNV
ncbi:MAG: hypothetical protein KDL87_14790 [Verrucomicrobiae bacterium]|nr:hypothetical protein [Verrucomicrobiae bacterium]